MRTLLKIEIGEDGEFGGVEYHCKSTDDLYALSQALFSVIARNPEIIAGVHAMMDMCKDNPNIAEKLLNNTIEVPDFNKLLKS